MIGLADITLTISNLHNWDVNSFNPWPIETAMKIRTLLVEDHLEVRERLRKLLMEKPDFELMGEAGDGKEALELIEQETFDVVIMDLNLPIMTGIDTAKRIVADHPDIKIIIMSLQSDPQYVKKSFEAGATGYLLKDCAYEEIVEAVHIVAAGGTYISPEIEIGVP
jgi:DNA-binding NarL/FixJ family response regulator